MLNSFFLFQFASTHILLFSFCFIAKLYSAPISVSIDCWFVSAKLRVSLWESICICGNHSGNWLSIDCEVDQKWSKILGNCSMVFNNFSIFEFILWTVSSNKHINIFCKEKFFHYFKYTHHFEALIHHVESHENFHSKLLKISSQTHKVLLL